MVIPLSDDDKWMMILGDILTSKDASEVYHSNTKVPMNKLKRNAEKKLDEQVEHQMKEIDVKKHVAQVSPNFFISLERVEHKSAVLQMRMVFRCFRRHCRYHVARNLGLEGGKNIREPPL